MTRLTSCVVLLSLLWVVGYGTVSAQSVGGLDKSRLAAEVREEFLHAWHGYEKYAWGHD
ncbi:MAG: hypothetical protein M1469_04550 [Bacteroidetes bacterium]|nr:hypothetical protein [Bacteroidota bacterium]